MSSVKKRNKNNAISQDKNEKDYKKVDITSAKSVPLRVLSRTVVIFSLLIVVYFSTKNHRSVTFARQNELLPGKSLIVKCSTEYLQELDKYQGCAPRNCKRYVSDKIVSFPEAEDLLQIALKGFEHGGSSGGASILDLHSGALSKGQHFINLYKSSGMENLFTQNDFNIFRIVKDKIKYAIAHHFDVNPTKIFLTHPTFFSKISNKEAITIHDEYWHPHIDKETYKSFHYTTLLYLADYDEDFKGGRFVFIDEKQNSTIEPRKGRVSMFTSGGENFHYVEKVTSGVRYAVTISFTCDKTYAIPDPNVDQYNS